MHHPLNLRSIVTPPKPVSGTHEWAKYSDNIALGCIHDCRYCYANEAARRRGTVPAGCWHIMRLMPDFEQRRFGKRSGRTMFPTRHDIVPEILDASVAHLIKLLSAGNEVLIVSKPHLDVIRRLVDDLGPNRDQVMFRFTIGSKNNETLRFWEPGAPSYNERLASLVVAGEAGFRTSVSMEPMLDENEDDIVTAVDDLGSCVTDTIWLGKANHLRHRMTMNGHWDTCKERAEALMASQSDNRITALYERLKYHPKVAWKDSIKAVVGLDRPTEPGADR